MKSSLYNIEIMEVENGNKVYFNSYTGAFAELENEYVQIIKTINSDNIDKFDKSKVEELKQPGFIIEDKFDEKLMLRHKKNLAKYSEKTLALTVAPTINCNMRCAYCYENKSSKRMNQEVKNQLKEFIKNKINSGSKRVFINWYGGEPMLEFETIRELSKDIISICKEKEVSYSSSMISNGVLLTKERAEILAKECELKSVQITLDGYGDTHNNSRVMANGKESFDTIVKNIEDIKEYINVSIRMNVSKKNEAEVEKLFVYLDEEKNIFENNRVMMYLAPVTNCQEACNVEDESIINFDQFGGLQKKYMDLIMRRKKDKASNFVKYPRPVTASCCAESINSFVVGPEGELYKCYQEIGLEEKIVGYLDGKPANNKVLLDYMEMDLPEDCENCEYTPVCQGGCLSDRIKTGNKPSCYTKKASVKEGLKKLYELM